MSIFESLHSVDDDIPFTITHSFEKIQFLDTLVYKQGTKLVTVLFVKSTDRNNILYYQSNHPIQMVDSFCGKYR